MSYEASEAVRTHSKAKRGARNVLFALAEVAARDGTVWLPIGPPDFEDSICHGAGLDSERQVIRCIEICESLDELEVRSWRDGRVVKNIYRLLVGPIRAKPVNYERPELRKLNLLEAFWTPDELLIPRADRPRQRVRPGPAKGTRRTDKMSVRQDGDALTNQASDGLTFPPGRTDNSGSDAVTFDDAGGPSRAREETAIGPGHEPSAAEPEKPSPPTSNVEAQTEQERPAAASSETEPISLDRAVAALMQLPGWDTDSLRIVEPLAMQVPEKLFEEQIAKTLARKASNPPGLLVHLLRVARNDWRKAQTDARLATWDTFFGDTGLERVKREQPRRYLFAWATPDLDEVRPREYVLQHVADYIFDHTDDPAARSELADYFIEASEGKQHHAHQLREWALTKLDRERAPLADVIAMLEKFTEGSPELRERLVAEAREIHANVERERREHAA